MAVRFGLWLSNVLLFLVPCLFLAMVSAIIALVSAAGLPRRQRWLPLLTLLGCVVVVAILLTLLYIRGELTNFHDQ